MEDALKKETKKRANKKARRADDRDSGPWRWNERERTCRGRDWRKAVEGGWWVGERVGGTNRGAGRWVEMMQLCVCKEGGRRNRGGNRSRSLGHQPAVEPATLPPTTPYPSFSSPLLCLSLFFAPCFTPAISVSLPSASLRRNASPAPLPPPPPPPSPPPPPPLWKAFLHRETFLDARTLRDDDDNDHDDDNSTPLPWSSSNNVNRRAALCAPIMPPVPPCLPARGYMLAVFPPWPTFSRVSSSLAAWARARPTIARFNGENEHGSDGRCLDLVPDELAVSSARIRKGAWSFVDDRRIDPW